MKQTIIKKAGDCKREFIDEDLVLELEEPVSIQAKDCQITGGTVQHHVTLKGSGNTVLLVKFTGGLRLHSSSNIIVKECTFTNCSSSGYGLKIDVSCLKCKVSQCVFEEMVKAQGIRIVKTKAPGDHFDPNKCVISECKFRNTAKTLENGGEAISMGYGWPTLISEKRARNVVCHCEFRDWHGDTEIISVKSDNNLLHDNEFRGCDGHVSIRYGDHNQLTRNVIKGCMGGIRVSGRHNSILSNVVEPQQGFPCYWLCHGNGDTYIAAMGNHVSVSNPPDGVLVDELVPDGCVIAPNNNTFIIAYYTGRIELKRPRSVFQDVGANIVNSHVAGNVVQIVGSVGR